MNNKNLVIIVSLISVAAIALVWFFFIKPQSAGGKSLGDKTGKANNCVQVVGEAEVLMNNEEFNPRGMTVKVCTKVTFKNVGSEAHWPASNLHPTHGIYPEFDPQQGINPQYSWSFVFDKVGAWKFHDHLNPQIVGTINVTQ